MFDLKLYSSNAIEIELASCVGYIGYISANIITKKEERGMERKKKKEQGKGEEKRNGEGKWGRGKGRRRRKRMFYVDGQL